MGAITQMPGDPYRIDRLVPVRYHLRRSRAATRHQPHACRHERQHRRANVKDERTNVQ